MNISLIYIHYLLFTQVFEMVGLIIDACSKHVIDMPLLYKNLRKKHHTNLLSINRTNYNEFIGIDKKKNLVI